AWCYDSIDNPAVARALPNGGDILVPSEELIADLDTAKQVAGEPRLAGQLIAWTDPHRRNDEGGRERSLVGELHLQRVSGVDNLSHATTKMQAQTRPPDQGPKHVPGALLQLPRERIVSPLQDINLATELS